MSGPRMDCPFCNADAYPEAGGVWECDFGHTWSGTDAKDADRVTLRELAEVATPGPWGVSDGEDGGIYPLITTPTGHGFVAEMGGGVKADNGPADAAYIAASSPDVILALLDERDALRAALVPLLKARHDAAHNGDIFRAGGFYVCGFCVPALTGWGITLKQARAILAATEARGEIGEPPPDESGR